MLDVYRGNFVFMRGKRAVQVFLGTPEREKRKFRCFDVFGLMDRTEAENVPPISLIQSSSRAIKGN